MIQIHLLFVRRNIGIVPIQKKVSTVINNIYEHTHIYTLYIHTHTHIYRYTYIYIIFMCLCVCGNILYDNYLGSNLVSLAQSSVLPKAYPHLLLKGITFYGWPPGYWCLHGIVDKIKHILGLKSSQSIILDAMGFDDSNGKITLEENTNKIRFTSSRDPLLSQKINAFQKLTKRLGGILFMSRYRSTSVHLLGGCIASSDRKWGL